MSKTPPLPQLMDADTFLRITPSEAHPPLTVLLARASGRPATSAAALHRAAMRGSLVVTHGGVAALAVVLLLLFIGLPAWAAWPVAGLWGWGAGRSIRFVAAVPSAHGWREALVRVPLLMLHIAITTAPSATLAVMPVGRIDTWAPESVVLGSLLGWTLPPFLLVSAILPLWAFRDSGSSRVPRPLTPFIDTGDRSVDRQRVLTRMAALVGWIAGVRDDTARRWPRVAEGCWQETGVVLAITATAAAAMGTAVDAVAGLPSGPLAAVLWGGASGLLGRVPFSARVSLWWWVSSTLAGLMTAQLLFVGLLGRAGLTPPVEPAPGALCQSAGQSLGSSTPALLAFAFMAAFWLFLFLLPGLPQAGARRQLASQLNLLMDLTEPPPPGLVPTAGNHSAPPSVSKRPSRGQGTT